MSRLTAYASLLTTLLVATNVDPTAPPAQVTSATLETPVHEGEGTEARFEPTVERRNLVDPGEGRSAGAGPTPTEIPNSRGEVETPRYTSLLVRWVFRDYRDRDDPVSASDPESVTILGTTDQISTTESILSDFEVAGLDLPSGLTVSYECPPPGKDSHKGAWFKGERLVCLWVDGHRVIRHELGHAHLDHVLSDEDKVEFAADMGEDSWAALDRPWGHRPQERAAEVIVWASQHDRSHHALNKRLFAILAELANS